MFGTTAPDSSKTVPEMSPTGACPQADKAITSTMIDSQQSCSVILIDLPSDCMYLTRLILQHRFTTCEWCQGVPGYRGYSNVYPELMTVAKLTAHTSAAG